MLEQGVRWLGAVVSRTRTDEILDDESRDAHTLHERILIHDMRTAP